MKTTRKKLLVFAAAVMWLFCGVLSQTALAAFSPASYFRSGAKVCAVVAPQRVAHTRCAMQKNIASTRVMPCCKKLGQCAKTSAAHAAKAAAASTRAAAKTSTSLSCRCEVRGVPLNAPPIPTVPGASQSLRASSDDGRRQLASHSSPFPATFFSRLFPAPSRAFVRRLERAYKPRLHSSSPPLPGRAPPVFA